MDLEFDITEHDFILSGFNHVKNDKISTKVCSRAESGYKLNKIKVAVTVNANRNADGL